jgi:replicative DNA helicase
MHVPPNDTQAEGCLLCRILEEPGAIHAVRGRLLPEHFYSEANRRIYEAACDLAASDKIVDVASVAARLRDTDRLEQVGGTAYLAELSGMPYAHDLEETAGGITAKWRLRNLLVVLARVEAEAHLCADTGSFFESAQQVVFEACQANTDSGVSRLADAMGEVYRELCEDDGTARYPQTGFRRLDDYVGGWKPGKLTVLCGSPGAGKSAFALQTALNAASMFGWNCIVFSAEMAATELGERGLSMALRVDMRSVASNPDDFTDWTRLANKVKSMEGVPLHVADGEITIPRIQSEVRRALAKGPLGLVVVDYIQLISAVRQRGDTLDQAIGTLTKQLKLIAMMGTHVLAISSLNRRQEDGPPTLNSLRDSGAIAFHADTVLALHHKQAEFENPNDVRDINALVLKNRGGPMGKFRLRFVPQFSTFEEV